MTIILILAAVFALAVFGWSLCRAAADTRPVDEGQAFGGQYGPRDE